MSLLRNTTDFNERMLFTPLHFNKNQLVNKLNELIHVTIHDSLLNYNIRLDVIDDLDGFKSMGFNGILLTESR